MSHGLLDVVKPTTDSKGAFAHSGVIKASPKLATYKTPHPPMQAFWAEPGSLGGGVSRGLLGDPQAGWVESPQAGAFADQKLCNT